MHTNKVSERLKNKHEIEAAGEARFCMLLRKNLVIEKSRCTSRPGCLIASEQQNASSSHPSLRMWRFGRGRVSRHGRQGE